MMFGNPEITTGGRALKYYSSIRMEVKRTEMIKYKEHFVGNRTRVKIVKNKVAPPFKDVEVEILYGEGIAYYSELLILAVANDIIGKQGQWFSYNDENIGNGRENTLAFLRGNPNITEEIASKIKGLDKVYLKIE